MAGSLRALALNQGALQVLEQREAIEAALQRPGSLLWLDFVDDIDPAGVALLEGLGVHPLVIEDMSFDYAQPKLEEFPGYIYVLLHALVRGETLDDLAMSEVDLLFNERWLVTHHHSCAVVNRVWSEAAGGHRPFDRGPAWLAHAIIDRLVDEYQPLLDGFDEELEQIETQIVRGENLAAALARIFVAKRALMTIRRTSAYQREILTRLGRRDTPHIPEALVPFFRDVYDHMGNIAMLAENYRELSSNLLDMHLSMQSNRMNEVMKTLTMFSTTLMPLSLIAGIYGMNFENMPELKFRYGYFLALGLMFLVGLGTTLFFKRKRWW
jgi:magnesium transporter